MTERTQSILYLIEGGLALDMVKSHIEHVQRVHKDTRLLAQELGVHRFRTARDNGVLLSVVFPGAVPSDWTKPDRHRCSRPKKGSAWYKRLAAQKGWEPPAQTIAEAFGVPLQINYKGKAGSKRADSEGWRCIGNMLSECGFLYLSEQGPYALWVPDVAAEVQLTEAEGYEVLPPAKGFELKAPGLRRIVDEEWDILVAQHNLKRKQEARERGERVGEAEVAA